MWFQVVCRALLEVRCQPGSWGKGSAGVMIAHGFGFTYWGGGTREEGKISYRECTIPY